jgi:hypothetical protein
MKSSPHSFIALMLAKRPLLVAALFASASALFAQPVSPPMQVAASAPVASALRHFMVEITTGPAWDPSKPPPAQAFFTEHSAHLRDLRRAGHITAGVRYSDKGLLVFAAADADTVRALLKPDPSLAHGTFRAEVHPMLVFYPGNLSAQPAASTSAAAPARATSAP